MVWCDIRGLHSACNKHSMHWGNMRTLARHIKALWLHYSASSCTVVPFASMNL